MSARIVGYVGGLFGILYLCAVCCASEEVLQVHIIPHSHCDVGWKKTVDEYYETQVHWILHNATRALQHQIFPDVTRKFNWDVQTYFQMWYEKLSESRKSEVQTLVANGQLDFVGFGWVQSDEAVADAFARVMQMTEGHNYIAKQFPNFINTTRVAWQIDPFGASSISPVLFSLAGYDGLVHERIPRAQQAEWKAQHKLQYQWTGNPANLTPPLWSHNLGDPTNDYCTPGDPPPPGGGPYGFDWEADDDGDPNKDPIITPENLKSRADVLVQIMHTRSKWLQPGVPLLFPFGCDFRFQDAEAQFVNMDKLIHYINENSEAYAIHLQYSLVSEWFQAVQATAKVWPSYKGDFLPYNNEKNNFWSGFYTSRPDIKRASRYAESLVRYAELLHGITSMKKTQPAELSYHLDSARQNISISQHHDAITGTSPDTTMIDYLRRLRYADMESAHVISQISEQYICGTTCNSSLSLYEAAPPSHKLPLIPITTDDQSELLPLVVANPLAWRQHQFVQFRTETLHIKLIMANKTIIPLQAVQETNSTQYLFSFIIDMLPLDTIVLYITSSTNPQNLTSRQEIKGASVSIHNSFLEFEINAEQGTITSITDKTSSDKVFVNQEFIQYYSPHSSAYSMKPDFWNILYPNHTLLKVEKAEGPLYSQIYVWFTDYFQWSLRLINTNDKFLGNNADFTALIGPVLNDTEVSIRFDTDWDTKGIWYSDNGLAIDTHTRVDLPYMDPTGVGSNFHSLKNTAFIQHSDGKRLVVLTAQSAGVSSLSDGQLEIMMNRRCGSWNDHTKVQLYYRFLYDSQSNLPSYQPQVTQQLQYPPVVLIGTPSENMFPTSNFQLISESLPENIHLFSLVAGSSLALGTPSTCGSTSVGIRLQNLSTTQTITVDPSSLFECSLCSREERGLTFLPLKNSTMNPIQSGPITMDPMALRTWVFSFNPCN